MRAILAVDDEGSTAASHLREEGIDVVAVVSADTPARAAADGAFGDEGDAFFGALAEVDVLILRVRRRTLTDGLVGLCDRRAVRIVALVGDDDDERVALQARRAFYARIPVGHVEAGLRTGNLHSPWPEEANRVLADQLCRWHFAPTERSASALRREHVDESGLHVTGNTVIDALLWVRDKVRVTPVDQFRQDYGTAYEAIAGRGPLVLITGHRRESFGGGFERICSAIRQLAERYPDTAFVYPVHLNPNVQEPVRKHLSGLDNVHLLAPLNYLPFVRLMDRCTLLLTDSGGIQEEAPSLGKPVLVLRDTTERPEGVEAGTVKLVGTDTEAIVREASTLLDDREAYEAMQRAHNPYGDGRAAVRIAGVLARDLA